MSGDKWLFHTKFPLKCYNNISSYFLLWYEQPNLYCAVMITAVKGSPNAVQPFRSQALMFCRIMYQPKVDVDKLKRCEGGCKLTFRALAYNHLHCV